MLFICLFAQEHADFRINELKSICSMFDIELKIEKGIYNKHLPYLLINLDSMEEARNILSRSVLLKSISKLFTHGSSYEEANTQINGWKDKLLECFKSGAKTFSFEVDTFNKKMSLKDKIFHIEEMQKYVEIPGDVNLAEPDIVFSLALYFDKNILKKLYFGELVGKSERSKINIYNLKERYFIGNTSMDPQLSLIMANQAQVRKGSFCYDPFAGTGSILIGCSHFGGFSGGGDIDYGIIYGRGKSSRAGCQGYRSKDEVIRTNFENYNLASSHWDILLSDMTFKPFRYAEIFDAIVTDPPYGIREGGRKLGSKKETTWDIPEDIRDLHIPAKKQLNLSNVIVDLIMFAYKYLVTNGRLVFWFPVYKPEYTEENLPSHGAFEIISVSEQPLTKAISRMLITMRKTKKWDENLANQTDTFESAWYVQQNKFRDDYFSVNSNGP